ncbi:MAG: hypothetical protein H6559_37395 [Lewinellaceae bacterium]|nr:hypothetical protein [Lewinellaceae bacterium]
MSWHPSAPEVAVVKRYSAGEVSEGGMWRCCPGTSVKEAATRHCKYVGAGAAGAGQLALTVKLSRRHGKVALQEAVGTVAEVAVVK